MEVKDVIRIPTKIVDNRREKTPESFLYSMESIETFIEKPLVPACKILYKKNIPTFLSGANLDDPRRPGYAYITLFPDLLDIKNKKIFACHLNSLKDIKPEHSYTIDYSILSYCYPINENTKLIDIEKYFTEIANDFVKQDVIDGVISYSSKENLLGEILNYYNGQPRPINLEPEENDCQLTKYWKANYNSCNMRSVFEHITYMGFKIKRIKNKYETVCESPYSNLIRDIYVHLDKSLINESKDTIFSITFIDVPTEKKIYSENALKLHKNYVDEKIFNRLHPIQIKKELIIINSFDNQLTVINPNSLTFPKPQENQLIQ